MRLTQLSQSDIIVFGCNEGFCMGRRAKWKDYVDLYFILHDYYSIIEISEEAEKIFSQQFSEKLFRQQSGLS